MSRRYTPEFNAYARRVVKSFNQRVMRAEKRGLKNLPSLRSVRELKAMYATENDLKKELASLREFNENRDALEQKQLGAETRITNWEFNYIKDNLKGLKDYYNREIEKVRARYKDQPYSMALREDLLNLEQRREYLNRDLLELNKSELATFRKYLSNWQGRNRRDINFYDQYFESFDFLMRVSGVEKSKMKAIREKINALTPQQFYELYKQHDVMGDLFEFVTSQERSDYYSKVREIENEKKEKVLEMVGGDTTKLKGKLDVIVDNIDEWIDKAKKIAG